MTCGRPKGCITIPAALCFEKKKEKKKHEKTQVANKVVLHYFVSETNPSIVEKMIIISCLCLFNLVLHNARVPDNIIDNSAFLSVK